MAYHLDLAAHADAFASGETTWQGNAVTFAVHEIGRLNVSSGRIAASDPLVAPNPLPFTRPVPVGTYPVSIAVASVAGDERVAYAQVALAEGAPVAWEMAVTGPADLIGLAEDGFFGYGVDSGTGCFMDPVAGELLEARYAQEENYAFELIDEMRLTYRDTRSWLVVEPQPGRPENVVFFSTGWGDGTYPTFFGLSASDRVVLIVSDFLLLWDDDSTRPDDNVDAASSKRAGWRFWKRK